MIAHSIFFISRLNLVNSIVKQIDTMVIILTINVDQIHPFRFLKTYVATSHIARYE